MGDAPARPPAPLAAAGVERRRVVCGVMIEGRRWGRVRYPVLHRVVPLHRAALIFYDAVSPTLYGEWMRHLRRGRKQRVELARAFVATGCEVWGRYDRNGLYIRVRMVGGGLRALASPVVLRAELMDMIRDRVSGAAAVWDEYDRYWPQPSDLKGTPQWMP